jgi:NAD/NADP transhydrogenase alpha subunit
MNNDTLAEIRARLHRLERQNRILIIGLCALVGVASIAATNHSGSIVTATEVRTPHLTMVDNHGKTLFEARCIDDNLYLKDYAGTVSNFGKW